MAIPDYQTVMLPLLQFLADGKEHNLAEVVEALAQHFGLSAEEQDQLLGSGQSTVIRNRSGWARTYLKKAGLVEYPRRGYFRVTDRGRSVLATKPKRIDVKFLEQYPEFVAFRDLKHDQSEEKADIPLAAGVLITIPALAFFMAVQRHLVAGWGSGGLKG
jgi:restriction system protein